TPTAAILGIDLGTTDVKVGLVSLDGRLLSIARAGYALDVDPETGRAEQDPGAWWSAVVVAVHALHPPEAVDVVAIGVDGHGPTLAAVDEGGHAVRPAITFLDTRAKDEAEAIAAATGIRGWALGPLPAALWLERNEAETAARTRWYLNTWEWLAFRLTGVAASPAVPGQIPPDPDVVRHATGLRVERRPPASAMGDVVGTLEASTAAALGLRPGIPVAGGTNDAFASYLGAGLSEAGDAYDPGGSAGGFGVYWHERVDVPGAFVTPAPLPGLYSVGAAMAATGRALDWFRDGVVGSGLSTEALLEEVATTPPGADGVVFLPYLAGERSPIWDPSATGAFVGLTLAHGRGHLARAILEASALAIRHVAEPMLAAGVRVNAMRACGGPARSETWNQIKADVTGFPVLVPAVLETAVLGSAMLGAVAIGACPDVASAVRSMTRIERRLEPRPQFRATYDRAYRIYSGLYPALRPVLQGVGT
ncbi:MAG TPA: FGGY-family carbohydrate kinase, partial [Candidatus Limnocylindrales bacterium]|nr:FGGY-family carbohydrate kinase [Candidatus Limnocylindrales bacterium]